MTRKERIRLMPKKITKSDIVQEITSVFDNELLSKSDIWVISGAALVLYGIRETTNDIDLGCTDDCFNRLLLNGYQMEEKQGYDKRIIVPPDIEVFGGTKCTAIEYIDNIPVASLEDIISFKRQLNREKDILDIKLIKAFLQKKNI